MLAAATAVELAAVLAAEMVADSVAAWAGQWDFESKRILYRRFTNLRVSLENIVQNKITFLIYVCHK